MKDIRHNHSRIVYFLLSREILLSVLLLILFLLSFGTTDGQINVTPTFDLGPQVALTAGPGAIRKDISNLLLVSDTDRGQLLTWSIVTSPAHGTLFGLPAFANSGNSAIAPSGPAYTPLAGQIQRDTFEIQISDGIKTSRIIVHVTILSSEPGADSLNQCLLSRNIATVQEAVERTVPFGTPYSDLKLPLEAEVTFTNQEKELLPVSWYPSNYNRNVAEAYRLMADVLIAVCETNSTYGKAWITINVLPNQTPSAIHLSDSIISNPLVDPDLRSNLFTSQDADDSVHTYQLVEGQGDSDNCTFGVKGGILVVKVPENLKVQPEFSIRVRSTDIHNNSLEKAFKLFLAGENSTLLTIPNTFSPNGDGINDVWIVPDLKDHKNVDIKVHDRVGVLMFHSTNPEQGWDGSNVSGKVVAGLYFYNINIGDINIKKQGVLTVLTY